MSKINENYKARLEKLGFKCQYETEPFCDTILYFVTENPNYIISGELDPETGELIVFFITDKNKKDLVFNLNDLILKANAMEEITKIEKNYNFQWLLDFLK